jgi:CheY-like chemotaxis protein
METLFFAEPALCTSFNKVLIVEDEPFWQLLIERALKKIDDRIVVKFTENANQALQELEKSADFDFIIADHLLSGSLTGLDLWDTLAEKKSEIPYILISGINKDNFFDRLMPYRTEMVPQFIEKPVSIRELSKKLNEAFISFSSKTRS